MPVMTQAEKNAYDAEVVASRFQDKSGVDVDTLSTPGLYVCDTNLPVAITGQGIMIVTVTDYDTIVFQEISDYTAKKSDWFRKSIDDGVTWEVWKDEVPDAVSAQEVEAIVREFQTIIEYDLIDEKKATRAECITTFKMLPNFDWTKNDTYHIRDTGGGNKLVMVTYFADGATDEATAGPFFSKDMSLAV